MERGIASFSSGDADSHQQAVGGGEASASGAAAAAAKAGTTTAGAAPPEERTTNYLVALAGMKALTSHVQDVKKGKTWKERVKGWEEKAGLAEPSVKLALGFLDILGVSTSALRVVLASPRRSEVYARGARSEMQRREDVVRSRAHHIPSELRRCARGREGGRARGQDEAETMW